MIPQFEGEGEMEKKEQLRLALLYRAVREAIKELGTVPAGTLYAAVMGSLSLDDFNWALDKMIKLKLVRRSNHELTWIGE
jgi:hypothetical protein